MANGIALVTGGARRLGRDMALCLAERGYDVAVHYAASDAEAEKTADDIRALGRSAQTFRADLQSEAETQTLIPRVADHFDAQVTVLINNAAAFDYDNLQSTTRASWDKHMETNLRAPFVLTQAVAATAPPPGHDANDEPFARSLVINMLDQRVRKLTPEFMSYTVSKMGLWALTQTMAQALAPAIRVNAIGPGPTVIGSRQSTEHFARQRANTVLERGSNPADIVAALGYLLDAPSVTGQLICVDGGQHLGWKTPDILGKL